MIIPRYWSFPDWAVVGGSPSSWPQSPGCTWGRSPSQGLAVWELKTISQNTSKLSQIIFPGLSKKKVFSYLGKKLIKILRTCRFIPFKFHCKFKKLNTVIHFFIAKLQGTSNWDFVYMSLQIPDYLIKHVKIMWLEQLSLEAYLMCPCFTVHACPWLCDLLSTRLGSLGRLEAWDTVSV